LPEHNSEEGRIMHVPEREPTVPGHGEPGEGAPAGKVLVVDDDRVNLKNVSRILKKDGYDVYMAAGGKEAVAKIERNSFDVVLTDLVMEDIDGLQVLGFVKEHAPDTEVIILTGYATVSSAIEAMKKGAYHYLQKPLRMDELRCVVAHAFEKNCLRRQLRTLVSQREEARGIDQIIGRSASIVALKKMILHAAATDSNVLISGESGTGKELVARAIHQESRRAEKQFQAINCGSFSEELLANELFGHEKEAYTGAVSSRRGLLEAADGGTLFFDEIGDMPPAMQAKLLRVIQERELIRVGGTRPIPIDVRIIAATNKDLKRAVESGLFRKDLYYRIAVVLFHVPSLADRKEDIPLLANHFLQKIQKRSHKLLRGFDPEAMELMERYDYPGNVRELENIVERAAAFATGETIRAEDLPPDIKHMEVFSFHKEGSHFHTLQEMEKEYIDWVMKRVGRNKSRVARILGIDRVSLYRKMKKHQIAEE